MYSLLIVEDELLPRTALHTMIADHFPEFSDIREAASSEEALELIHRHKPDILLVDINLPGQTGLELCQQLAAQNLASHTIITTAYGRFNYAKTAMEIGCQAYLLKPIGDRELELAIRKCIAQIEQKKHATHISLGLETMRSYIQPYMLRSFRKDGLVPSLLQNGYGWPRDGHLSSFFLNWQTTLDDDSCLNLLLSLTPVFQNAFNIIADVSQGTLSILLQPKNTSVHCPVRVSFWLFTSLAARQSMHKTRSLGKLRFSGPFSDYQQLNHTFQNETGLLTAQLPPGQPYLEAGTFLGKNCFSKKRRTLLRQKIVQRFREGSLDRAASVLYRIEKENQEQMIQLLLEALWTFCPELDIIAVWNCMAERVSGVSGIHKWLRQIWNLHLTDTQQLPCDSIDTALQIMQTRYANPLSEASIAEEVGLSQSYFSRLFKQRTGENFSTVLLRIRLQHACEQIDCGSGDLNKIASDCGFTSGRYLDMNFRQIYGLSVAQYRLRKGGEN